MRRPASFVLILAGLRFCSAGPVLAAADPGSVYCLDQGGTKIFAGRQGPDGNLAFGLSVWSPSGQNISVFGIANRRGDAWRFTDDAQAATPTKRCRLDIVLDPDGALRVTADRDATCQSYGGANVEIGRVQFPAASREGAVTTELDDPEAFQRAGKCVGAGH